MAVAVSRPSDTSGPEPAHDSRGQPDRIAGRGRAVLQALVDAHEQHIAQKRPQTSVCILYDPRLLVVDLFDGAEYAAAGRAGPPAPDAVGAFLAARVCDARVGAAISTNHVNILSCRCKKRKWITFRRAGDKPAAVTPEAFLSLAGPRRDPRATQGAACKNPAGAGLAGFSRGALEASVRLVGVTSVSSRGWRLPPRGLPRLEAATLDAGSRPGWAQQLFVEQLKTIKHL